MGLGIELLVVLQRNVKYHVNLKTSNNLSDSKNEDLQIALIYSIHKYRKIEISSYFRDVLLKNSEERPITTSISRKGQQVTIALRLVKIFYIYSFL